MKGFTVSAVEMKDAKKKGPAHTWFTAWIVIMPYSKYILEGHGGRHWLFWHIVPLLF